MPHTRRTLALNYDWDLVLDTDAIGGPDGAKTGRLALREGAWATAQNVANEARVFTDDLAFERDRGIPYFLLTLGHKPSPSVLKARLRDAALRVEDVAEVEGVDLESLDTDTRLVRGEIRCRTLEGEDASAEI